MDSRQVVLAALVAALPAVAACKGSFVEPEQEPPCVNCFSIRAEAATSGANPDPDGYLVSLDGGAPLRVGGTGTVTFARLRKGPTYVVRIDDVDATCSVLDGPVRTVVVPETDIRTLSRKVSFEVTCP